jgi:hypothetical protein
MQRQNIDDKLIQPVHWKTYNNSNIPIAMSCWYDDDDDDDDDDVCDELIGYSIRYSLVGARHSRWRFGVRSRIETETSTKDERSRWFISCRPLYYILYYWPWSAVYRHTLSIHITYFDNVSSYHSTIYPIGATKPNDGKFFGGNHEWKSSPGVFVWQ